MKGWYFCVVMAGLLLSSCSQQVQERADGGKTSDTIVAESPVEELRFYRIPFVSEIFGCDRRESFLFSMEGFPKIFGGGVCR